MTDEHKCLNTLRIKEIEAQLSEIKTLHTISMQRTNKHEMEINELKITLKKLEDLVLEKFARLHIDLFGDAKIEGAIDRIEKREEKNGVVLKILVAVISTLGTAGIGVIVRMII